MRYVSVVLEQIIEDPNFLYKPVTESLSIYTKLDIFNLNSQSYVLIREHYDDWQTCLHVYWKNSKGAWRKACTYWIENDSWDYNFKRTAEDATTIINSYRDKMALFG